MKPCFHLGNSREFLGQSSFPSKGVLFPYSSKTSLPMDILPSSLDSFHTHGCVPQAPIDRVSVVVSSLKQLFQGHKHKLIAPQVTVAADGSMIVHDGPWVPPIQETHTHTTPSSIGRSKSFTGLLVLDMEGAKPALNKEKTKANRPTTWFQGMLTPNMACTALLRFGLSWPIL